MHLDLGQDLQTPLAILASDIGLYGLVNLLLELDVVARYIYFSFII